MQIKTLPALKSLSWCDQKETGLCDQKWNNPGDLWSAPVWLILCGLLQRRIGSPGTHPERRLKPDTRQVGRPQSRPANDCKIAHRQPAPLRPLTTAKRFSSMFVMPSSALWTVRERSAVIYSLLGSCWRHRINPFDYLKDLFTRLPAAKITEIHQFTPAAWAKVLVQDEPATMAA